MKPSLFVDKILNKFEVKGTCSQVDKAVRKVDGDSSHPFQVVSFTSEEGHAF